MNLDDSIAQISGVGPSYVSRLEKLQLSTIDDLLHHYPFRYEDYSQTTPAAQARIGDTVTIQGKIHAARNDFTKTGKKLQKIQLFDGTGSILLVFFNQPYLISTLKVGTEIAASGEVRFFGRSKALIAPEYEVLYDRDPVHTGRLVPVYHETAGVSSKWLRSKIAYVLKRVDEVHDYMPQDIVRSEDMISLQNALHHIHFPTSYDDIESARQRLAFDEMFLMILGARYRKEKETGHTKAYPIDTKKYKASRESLISHIPFTLTDAQTRCIDEILADMSARTPMNRLLQGDVGSGKTIVAATALYAAYNAGYQSVLMAPTDILAKQHYASLKNIFDQYSVPIQLLTSSKKKMDHVDNDQPSIFVGTHALLHHKNFRNLGLVIVDEQHRFGVEQRAHLRKQDIQPHMLSMTATPIPRSVALLLQDELALSFIDEMPHGRKPVKTWLIPNEKRKKAYEWIRSELNTSDDQSQSRMSNQAFFIFPLIDESEHESMQSVRAATKEYETLKKSIFPELRVELVHGRTKPKQRDSILVSMQKGDVDILVATSVVEVGIDIPNATIIVIEGADRFGLAQLHQLRGRVGRSDKQSYCLLFTESTNPAVHERLSYVSKNSTGSELAALDFKLRGPGDVFGTRQSGFMTFKLASFADIELIKRAKHALSFINESYESLSNQLQDKLKPFIIQTTDA